MNRLLILAKQQDHFFFHHRLSSGQIREVEVFVCSIRIKGKAYLFSVLHDITERRQMEQHIAEVSEFVQKIFDASPMGIIAYEASGQCVMANEAAGRIIGASREVVLQQNFNHLDSWKASGLLAAALEVIQTNQPRENIELNIETTIGKDVTVNCNLVPFSSANKPHLLLMGQDISRQKQADAALRQSQKLAAIGLLVAGIAHEISNPNGFIIFNIPILKDYLQELMPIIDDYMGNQPDRSMFGRPYEAFRRDLFKLLDNIEHGAHRINATVSGLRDFSRKREKLAPRRVDLKPVIENAVSFCRSEIRKSVTSIYVNIDDNLQPIRTDPEAVEQILVNLLINATHASDKEDSWIRLCASANSGKPDGCIITVDDNGCGMDEKTLTRIFDPFYTRKPSVQGTGLGLYICQDLAEGLGGRIEVESRPDQGSSFKVILNDFL
jgi:PAS domain S-box-containing protein